MSPTIGRLIPSDGTILRSRAERFHPRDDSSEPSGVWGGPANLYLGDSRIVYNVCAVLRRHNAGEEAHEAELARRHGRR